MFFFVRCNGLVDGASRISNACGSAPYRKMGVHHAGGGIISTDQRKQQDFSSNSSCSERYKPLFANIPSARNDNDNRRLLNRPNLNVNVDNIKKEGDSGNNIKKLTVSSALNSRRNSSDRVNGATRKFNDNLDSNSTTKHSIIGNTSFSHNLAAFCWTRHLKRCILAPCPAEYSFCFYLSPKNS